MACRGQYFYEQEGRAFVSSTGDVFPFDYQTISIGLSSGVCPEDIQRLLERIGGVIDLDPLRLRRHLHRRHAPRPKDPESSRTDAGRP